MAERLVEANLGEPVDVVLEMAGGEVFEQSMQALAPFGRCVAYGIATQQQNEVRTGLAHARLARRRRLLAHALPRSPGDDRRGAGRPLRRVARGRAARRRRRAPIRSPRRRRAQVELAERRTTGKLLLDPAAA